MTRRLPEAAIGKNGGMDGVRWGFAVLLVGGVVLAYLVDEVPFVAVVMATVGLAGVAVTVHAGRWWIGTAAVGLFAGIIVETLRAVVGAHAFDPFYAVAFGVVIALAGGLFERARE